MHLEVAVVVVVDLHQLIMLQVQAPFLHGLLLLRVYKVLKVRKEFRDQLVLQVFKGHKVHKEYKDLLVLLVLLDQLV